MTAVVFGLDIADRLNRALRRVANRRGARCSLVTVGCADPGLCTTTPVGRDVIIGSQINQLPANAPTKAEIWIVLERNHRNIIRVANPDRVHNIRQLQDPTLSGPCGNGRRNLPACRRSSPNCRSSRTRNIDAKRWTPEFPTCPCRSHVTDDPARHVDR